ncbi:DUF221 domain protein, putative [Cordyceps militaris CM01]|uniref:DUF221 domain protein, putative n=2 Tax=Cordyceps militaris TaxID=73501 RepID=G3J5P9_CORMM|nr:DUF221 domain protein, putative [Cordyceps militaris CM01]ATY65766.1 DUF221 domain [Cordyceps militaris]EGX96056.1 DUF221 domain protein, putative [Cordyceps militaris CM01]
MASMASMAFTPGTLAARDDKPNSSPENPLLDLFKDPFASTLASSSLYSALGISIGFTVFLAVCFSLLRPHNQAVYAPKVKHADEKHAPPAIGKSLFAWVPPVLQTNEDVLMHTVGMDATIFIRFMRMCRNMFLVLSLVGVGILIPVHLTTAAVRDKSELGWLVNISPLNVFGRAQWVQVIAAYLFDAIVAGFLWWNYRKIAQLRRRYFETEDFLTSLASRTLMLYDIPRECASDEGIARIIDAVAPSSSFARTAIARNVKELPELIEQHEHTVRKLEQVLAKYLKNPAKLPANRPTCKPSKKDHAYSSYPSGQKLDAIDYYTKRISTLEAEIKQVRASVDKRSTMPYGFASYSDIAEAHSIAYSFRKKKSQGATVTLAPRPNDIIWRNMPLSTSVRSRRRWANSFWITVLTLLWIGPNALIAMLFVNLSNLGRLWPAFKTELVAKPGFWGLVQGILAPTLTSLVYIVLPMIFRRLSTKGGDQTKTGRERHVIGKMYAFFVFNNLIVFSFFSTVFTFVFNIIRNASNGESGWEAIKDANKNNGQSIIDGLFQALCSNGVFWVTYMLQRQLGAATDLAQLWSLTKAFFLKKFSSPTPRELIELTAPPPFEYSSYYTYFLFYATTSLCFAGIMPLVLPAAAMYFSVDHYLKKYLILYRFITKTESGGLYWRVVFNRFVFGTMLANLVVLLTTWVRGDANHIQFYAVIPLPFLMLGFKFWCANAYDNKIRFYSLLNVHKNPEAARAQADRLRSEKLASRFGHPALYKKLITPMVHQKAQNLLPSVYSGRLTDGREAETGDLMSVSGYSDMYALDSMKAGKAGKATGVPGFEFVSENHMDFEYFKNRAEFLDEHGGAEFYGIESDAGTTRAGTPVSFDERPGSAKSGRTGTFSAPRRVGTGMSDTSYNLYRPQNGAIDGAHSRQASANELDRMRSPLGSFDNSSSTGLVQAQPMGGYSEVPMDGRGSPGPQYSRYDPDSGRASPAPVRTIAGHRGYQQLDGGRASPGRMSPAPRSRSQSPGPATGPLGAALRQMTQSPGSRQTPAPRTMSPAPRVMSPAPGRAQSPGPAAGLAMHQPSQHTYPQTQPQPPQAQQPPSNAYYDDFQGVPGQPGFYGGPSR